jgi:hypothetical protein
MLPRPSAIGQERAVADNVNDTKQKLVEEKHTAVRERYFARP